MDEGSSRRTRGAVLLQADDSGGSVSISIHPGVRVTDPEGAVILASLTGRHQLLIQAKEVPLAVGGGANEARHSTLSMTLQIRLLLHDQLVERMTRLPPVLPANLPLLHRTPPVFKGLCRPRGCSQLQQQGSWDAGFAVYMPAVMLAALQW